MSLCGDHKKLNDRLNRIEGQIGGIRKMIQDDRDCFDVLKQLAAVIGALRSMSMVIMEDHLRGCVTSAILEHQNDERLIGEVIDIFNKFTK